MAKSKAAMERAREAEALQRAGKAGKTAAETRRLSGALVENAHGNGGCDAVTVVSDTVAWLAARGKLEEDQRAAAERYRRAHGTVHAGLACVLGLEGVGGPRGGDVSARRLDAARTLSEADAALGPLSRVMRLVVCEGLSVDEAAQEIHGSAGRGEKAAVTHMLRLALRTLADLWEWPQRRQEIRSSHAADYRPTVGDGPASGLIGLMQVAHCTLRRVYLA